MDTIVGDALTPKITTLVGHTTDSYNSKPITDNYNDHYGRSRHGQAREHGSENNRLSCSEWSELVSEVTWGNDIMTEVSLTGWRGGEGIL